MDNEKKAAESIVELAKKFRHVTRGDILWYAVIGFGGIVFSVVLYVQGEPWWYSAISIGVGISFLVFAVNEVRAGRESRNGLREALQDGAYSRAELESAKQSLLENVPVTVLLGLGVVNEQEHQAVIDSSTALAQEEIDAAWEAGLSAGFFLLLIVAILSAGLFLGRFAEEWEFGSYFFALLFFAGFVLNDGFRKLFRLAALPFLYIKRARVKTGGLVYKPPQENPFDG